MEVAFLLSAELDLFQVYEQHGDALHDKIDTALQFLQAHPDLPKVPKSVPPQAGASISVCDLLHGRGQPLDHPCGLRPAARSAEDF